MINYFALIVVLFGKEKILTTKPVHQLYNYRPKPNKNNSYLNVIKKAASNETAFFFNYLKLKKYIPNVHQTHHHHHCILYILQEDLISHQTYTLHPGYM